MRVPPSQDAPQTWQDGRCDCRTRSEHDRMCFTRDRAAIRNSDEADDRIAARVAGAMQSPGIKAVVEVVRSETEELRAERDFLAEGNRVACARFEVAERRVRELTDALELVNDTLTLRSAAHDRLVATIGRVRAVAADLRSLPGCWVGPWVHSYNALEAIEAALDAPTEDTP